MIAAEEIYRNIKQAAETIAEQARPRNAEEFRDLLELRAEVVSLSHLLEERSDPAHGPTLGLCSSTLKLIDEMRREYEDADPVKIVNDMLALPRG